MLNAPNQIKGNIGNTIQISGNPITSNQLDGNLNTSVRLSAKATTSLKLKGSLKATTKTVGHVAIGGGYIPTEYQGSYIVIPKADQEQVLQTADKLMTDNVTVRKVPYYETSNLYGETVYIASEV